MSLTRLSARGLFALTALAGAGLLGCFGMPKALQKNGVPATATILEVWDTGWTVNDDPVIGMAVRVQPPSGASYEARIEKTPISRIAVPQFQPGATVPVRFDPQNPALVAVDFDPPAAAPVASSGNPYRDHYVRAAAPGTHFLPPPPAPDLFLGTSDSATDTVTLVENGFELLGASEVANTPDPRPAVEQGKEIGAAVVVVYGHFDPPGGTSLEVLPYRRSAGATGATMDAASLTLVQGLGPGQQVATYWGKTSPPVLGVYTRSLNEHERAALGGSGGVMVDGVSQGSPAEAAHVATGDVIVAIDGHAVATNSELKDLVGSLAGRSVSLDLLRHGARVAVQVALNNP